MIEGNEVTIGGRTFIAAPLNFRALEKFGPFIQSLTDDQLMMTQIPTVRDLIAASLRRNHPEEITDDFLLDNLDMSNIHSVLIAVLTASGGKVVETAPGEA